MQLWQATWNPTDHTLLLWGEDANLAQETRGNQVAIVTADSETPRQHPFSSPVNEMERNLAELEFESSPSDQILLLLPTDELGPLPSQGLLLDEQLDRKTNATLVPWTVPAISLQPLEALSFLTSISDQPSPGLRFDHSLIYWRECTKLLLELLTRGRFLPGLLRQETAWHSHWHILPKEEIDHQRLNVLAESMPPICRAVLAPQNFTAAPQPSALLESFLSHCADRLIRAFLARHSLTSVVDRGKIPPRQALPVEWLNCLTSSDSQMPGAEYELIKFEQRLRTWAGGLVKSARSHSITTGFRLYAPGEKIPVPRFNSDSWVVTFCLHDSDDKTKELLPAQLFAGVLGFLQTSDYSAEELEERLLSDLAKALNVFPELRNALNTISPSHVEITTEQAYDFLKEHSQLLEELGHSVTLPSWWKQSETKVGLSVKIETDSENLAHQANFGFLAANQLLDYSWEIALGNKTLAIEEFRKLVAKSSPLINVGDQWVELPPEKLRNTLDYLDRQQGTNKLRLLEALRLGLGIEDSHEMLPVVGFSAGGWLQKLLEKDLHSLPDIKEPEGFTGSLRSYQQEGLSWLAFLSQIGVGACLADDMGLGKTIQLLALLVYEKNQREPKDAQEPTLLVVPMSILANWEQEAARFAPGLLVYVHHGAERLSNSEFITKASNCDIVVTTYSLVFRDEAVLAKVPWRRLALDEAQNIKNLETKQTKAVRRLAFTRTEQSVAEGKAFHRVALTGTPLENHLEELWSIFDYLNPGFLGTLKDFRTRFVLPIERFREKNSAATLSKLIAPFVLRRCKSDPKIIGDLPEKIEMRVITSLTDEQASLYQSVVDRMLPQVGSASGIHRKGLVLSTITKLKQICDHPALYLKDKKSLKGRSGKLERLEELLEVVLAEGDRVLIFTQYAQMGHLLKPYLQEQFDTEVLFLHGALSRKAREGQLEKFRQPNGPKIFILSLKAGGFGLNLTEANQVIHFDQWWNPAVEEQATDRAYRIGQIRNVQVRKFICQGTLEEKISALLEHKKDLADQVVGTTKNMVTELSADRLRELLELTKTGPLSHQ